MENPARGGTFQNPQKVELTRWEIFITDKDGILHYFYVGGGDGIYWNIEEARIMGAMSESERIKDL